MRAIIAGGSGLIGRELAASLAGDGYEVIVLSRRPERVRNLATGVRAERWDGRTADGWGKLADGADAIINLAGEGLASGLWTADRKLRIRQSRIAAGQAIVQAVQAATNKPRVVIQQSGIGHYGFHGDEIITEADVAGRDFLASVTLDWEAATAPVEAWGVRRVITRSAPVLSKKGGLLSLMMLPFRFFVGGPLGSGRQWLPWIHMADEIAIMRLAISNDTMQGAFNATAPHPVTNAEFSRILGRVMHRPSFMRVPAFAIRLALGELADSVLQGQRAVPDRLLKMGYVFRFPDLEGALRDLLGRAG